MKFTKMQGLGNDYIYVNCYEERVENPGELAKKISDRHFGVGSDGLVLICPSEKADFRMRMFNADGSEAEMCGNASRCVGKYVYERGMTGKTEISLETKAGIRGLRLKVRDGLAEEVTVDMGVPEMRPEKIPTLLEEIAPGRVEAGGREFEVWCVNMGNPHCVVFTKDADGVDVAKWGPEFERHEMFPERVNTEFAQVMDRENIRMRVWERGAGETMACGTGACATFVAAEMAGKCGDEVKIHLNGGVLKIRRESEHVVMTGPAEFVFEGCY